MKNLLRITFVLIVLVILFTPKEAYASDETINSTEAISTVLPQITAQNAQINALQGYLTAQNSPLAPYAKSMVENANENNIDWRLVAAISGVESSFGLDLPTNSYNCWGFGIYADNVRYFASYSDGIETVSKSLRQDYLGQNQATNVYLIGSKYAADPNWASRVETYMDAISSYQANTQINQLPLSL